MVDTVAEYLRIVNDNNIMVVDENSVIPKLLYRGTLVTDVNLTNNTAIRRFDPTWTKQSGFTVVKEASTLRGVGFDYDDTTANVSFIEKQLIAFGRSSDNVGFDCSVVLTYANGLYSLKVSAFSDTQGAAFEVAVYAFDVRVMPSKFGVHVYDPSGTLVFDALKGCMQNIGTIGGGNLSMGASTAATYNIVTPTGLSASNIFISFRSQLPYYAAFKISSGGVSWADTCYVPRMAITNGNVKVELVKQRSTGSSSSYSFGGYFENVVYIKQPPGTYI